MQLVAAALKSQYHAALQTLRLCIEQCPAELWANLEEGPAQFWRAVYHTLFYAHFYGSKSEKDFVPWPKHRIAAVDLEQGKGSDYDPAITPYTRDEMLEYCAFCDDFIDQSVDALDLASEDCGFPWYMPMTKLEHQFVNLRHIQHHAASLSTRLRLAAKIRIRWVGRVKKS